MKLISLNTWGGKIFEPLINFINKHSQDTDIFCFQEIYDTISDVKQYKGIVRANLLDELKNILPDFKVFYTVEFSGYDSDPNPVDFDLSVGKAIFTKKYVNISGQGELLIHGNRNETILKKDFSNLPITLQYINCSINGKLFTICNYHGTPAPGSKLDTPLRLKQSAKILDFLKNESPGLESPGIFFSVSRKERFIPAIKMAGFSLTDNKTSSKIITGDFNLLPQTQSIKMIEASFRNLIEEFKIERTRSNLSPFYKKSDFQKYADYVFASQDVIVTNFEVPKLNLSDHLPLILEFN